MGQGRSTGKEIAATTTCAFLPIVDPCHAEVYPFHCRLGKTVVMQGLIRFPVDSGRSPPRRQQMWDDGVAERGGLLLLEENAVKYDIVYWKVPALFGIPP